MRKLVSKRRGPSCAPISRRSSSGWECRRSRPRSCPLLPGLDEVFALGDLRDHLESGLWDVIVVDCAPTAETLRLLTLPEVLSWWMDRLFPLSRQVSRLVGPRVVALYVAARSRRLGVRRAAALLRPHRRRAEGAERPDADHRASRREPGAHGDRRSASHVHLPLVVRIPGRRRDREPHAARRDHRSLVRRVEVSRMPATWPTSRPRSPLFRCFGRLWLRASSPASKPSMGSGASSTAPVIRHRDARGHAAAGLTERRRVGAHDRAALRRKGSRWR